MYLLYSRSKSSTSSGLYRHFHDYHLFEKSGHVFITEVMADFEQTVTVCEGEYGRFFSIEEIREEPLMLPWVLTIIEEFARYLDLRSAEP